MAEIKCSVDTCVYNKKHKCDADCIEVCNCGCSKANKTKETECDTFRLK